MLAAAYSPVALVVLGTQMITMGTTSSTTPAEHTISSSNRAFWAGMSIRLVGAPLLSWVLLTLLHVEGILFSVLLILTSMPTAVNAVILAGQFNAAPQLVSRCILWTTLASFIVMPVLIVWLQ